MTLAKLFGVSSATIRSEMAKLEEMGFIEAPHTSAGRIPTDKGYRFYVNGITNAQMTELPSGINRSARAIEAHVNSHVDKRRRFLQGLAVSTLAASSLAACAPKSRESNEGSESKEPSAPGYQYD